MRKGLGQGGLDKGGTYGAAEGVGMCAASVVGAYRYAKSPALLHVGIVDQRCRGKCRTGVFKDGQRDAGEKGDGTAQRAAARRARRGSVRL